MKPTYDVTKPLDTTSSLQESLLPSKQNFSNTQKIVTQTEKQPFDTEKKAFDENDIPSHLIDVITQGIIAVDPHTLKCGHSFNKGTLIRSLQHSTTCPQCRAEVKKEDVQRNEALALEIAKYIKDNPLAKSYYEEQKASVLRDYPVSENEKVHPGENVRRRSDYLDRDYPSIQTTSYIHFIDLNQNHNSESSYDSNIPSSFFVFRDMFISYTDYIANLFFDPLSELIPGNPGGVRAEYNRRVSIGRIIPRYSRGHGIIRFKRYFSSLFTTKMIPEDLQARRLYYSGFSGKLKLLTQSVAKLSDRVFNVYHQISYSSKAIYEKIKEYAKNGYLDEAIRLVKNSFKNNSQHWIDKSYARIAQEHVADDVTDANLTEVYKISAKIKDDKIRDNLFEKVAKICTKKREYLKATRTVFKMTNFLKIISSFCFIWSMAFVLSFQLMIDVIFLPFKYLIKNFIKD